MGFSFFQNNLTLRIMILFTNQVRKIIFIKLHALTEKILAETIFFLWNDIELFFKQVLNFASCYETEFCCNDELAT